MLLDKNWVHGTNGSTELLFTSATRTSKRKREVVGFSKDQTFPWENTTGRGGKLKADFVYERKG